MIVIEAAGLNWRHHRATGETAHDLHGGPLLCVLALLAYAGLMAAAPVAAQTITSMAPAINASQATQTAVPPPTAAPDGTEDGENDAFTPIGARFGAFMLYPKIETALAYNDNIYALKNKTSDEVARISPSFDLQGDFGQITTDARATLDRYQYFHNTRENRTDWSIGGNGQIELHPDTFGYLAGGFSHAHEDRGDPNSIFTSRSPTSYYLGEAGAGFSSAATRLHYGLDLSLRDFNYQDGRQIGGGVIDNDDRDRQQYRVAGRVGFEFSPGYTLLARGTYERVNYDRRFTDDGYRRDSDGFRGTLGIDFSLTRLLTGEVFVGYLRRTFDDPRSHVISKPVFGSSLSWTPRPLVTVALNGDRTVQETISVGYSSFVSTNFTLSGSYAIRRAITLDAQLRYGRDQYERQSDAFVTHRRDNNYGASIGGKYHLNRNLYAGLSYDWLKRGSNVSLTGVQFSRNRLTATLGLQF